MQDYVVGIHLIGANGRHAWIERESRKVVSDQFVQMLGAELIRDDEMFNGVVVSFGSFGVVHAYMLQVEKAFMLEQYVKKVDFATALKCVGDGIDATPLGLPRGGERPFHFEFVVDPYHLGAGENGARARVMYKAAFVQQPPAPAGGTLFAPSADILGKIGSLLDAAPAKLDAAALRFLVPKLLDGSIPEISGVIGTPAIVFGDTTLRTGGTSMELGFELPDVPRAAEILGHAAQDNLYAGILAFRFVKASQATLAFTRGTRQDNNPPDRTICTVETDACSSDGTTAAMAAFWRELDAAKINYTLHWGQVLRQDDQWVRKAYGDDAVDSWLAKRREWLPTQAAQRLFSSDLLDALGLST
jgi:hypothetical protein